MSLRARLILALLSVVFFLGAITTYTGSRLISGTILREAQHRTKLDLRSASAQFDGMQCRIQEILEHIAARRAVTSLAVAGATDEASALLASEKSLYNLDILRVCDLEGVDVLRLNSGHVETSNRAEDSLVKSALAGKAANGIILLNRNDLEIEENGLADRAFMRVVPTPHAKPSQAKFIDKGMMLWAAAPVKGQDGRVFGAVYGGVLLNRNWALVDHISSAVFGDELYEGRELGTVTIFLHDVRIATNVRDAGDRRSIGTRISGEVSERVIGQGVTWFDRAFVVNDWYISAYEPIFDPTGEEIGILYTGILEKKYTDLRNGILRSFFIPVAAGTVLAIVLAVLIARSVAKPVAKLSEISKHLADGDYSHTLLPLGTVREINSLAEHFTQMATAIRRRDEKLIEQNRALEGSNEALCRLNRNYMEMLGFVSHELKNPLNVIIFGSSSVMNGHFGPVSDIQKNTIESVVRNAQYLVEMVESYLNLSRIEKGELEVHKQDADLANDVIHPMLKQLESQMRSAGMRIETEAPDAIEIYADPGLLRIVMDNLLSNAAKYGVRGGMVRVSVTDDPDKVTVSVWNEGEGISPGGIEKLFGKFVRLDDEVTKTRKGTGLGLFVCKEIVTKHGGRIWAESEQGQWARFSFVLPKGVAAAETVLGDEVRDG